MTWARRWVPRPVRRAASAGLARLDAAQARRTLAGLAAGDDPVVAGPWMGEVGFELLYWVPFLAWFAERYSVDPARMAVLSRGGTGSWYSAFSTRYLDVLDVLSPADFHARHDARVRDLGEQKQTRATQVELDLVARMTGGTAAAGGRLLHPSVMYRLMRRFWWGHLDTDWVHRHTRYRRHTPPPADTVPGLPASYVAVKFYFNECFPDSRENRDVVRRTLERLAAQGPVVSLSAGVTLDDHGGFHLPVPGVLELPGAVAPSRNLEAQAAVVARARAFVGTYGGFAYLAPFYGVPSTACYSNPDGFARSHLAMARSALERIGSGGLLQLASTADRGALVVN